MRSTMYQISSILLAGTGLWKISSVACGFSSIKIDYSDYPKSLISRIDKIYVFFNKISIWQYFIEKHKNFIYDGLFAAITLAIVLAWCL